jgi:hypothetical protein
VNGTTTQYRAEPVGATRVGAVALALVAD